MGLDIYHSKVLESTEGIYLPGSSIITPGDMERFDVDSSFFNTHWSVIKRFTKFDGIRLATNKAAFTRAKKYWSNINKKVEVLYCNSNQKEKFILDIKSRAEFRGMEMFIKDELDWMILDFCTYDEIEGFYTHSVGYQRKGVVDEFFKHFGYYATKISNFTSLDAFEQVYSFIGKHWPEDTDEDVLRTKALFKRDFLNNYEFGKSILTISD